jgi:hypothetical protein
MANFSFSASASLGISGITPAAGPTSTDKVNATFTGAAGTADDRLAQTFTVNASTTATAIDMGKIVSGKALWIESDGALLVSITQDQGAGPIVNVVKVDKFLYIQSIFTAVSVANPSATTAVHLSIVVAGDRIPVGGGAGVF